MNLFEDIHLSNQLSIAIKNLGFDKPTQIQEKSIPYILEGKDVIGESATGSGKTLAFGCGIIDKVIPRQGLQALILTPTRELAEQVKNSLNELSSQKSLKIITIYGGVAINPQIHDLTKADVVVATPGRFLDHLQRGTVNTSRIKLLVIDEADRMFDMGFIDDVERIISACPRERQTLLFSATILPSVKDLANRHMDNPIEVFATKMVDPSKLKQVYYDVTRNMKLSVLVHLLEKERSGLVMVFCNTRRTVDFVVKNLKANKVNAIAIHGGLSQNKRTRTMSSFNSGNTEVLVCTDVAARGLHIDNVSHIYNYEIPSDPIDYVHRIGRTARAGEEGKAVNLLCEHDYDGFSRIQGNYREFRIDKAEKPHVERIMTIKADEPRRSFGRNDGHGRNGRRGPPRRGNFQHDRGRRYNV